jgi:hypothetical protein
MEHAYLTQENIIRALVQHAITEIEANKLLQLLMLMTTTKR